MFLISNSRKVSFTNQVVLSNQAGDSNEQPAGNLQSLTAGCDQNYIKKKKKTPCVKSPSPQEDCMDFKASIR